MRLIKQIQKREQRNHNMQPNADYRDSPIVLPDETKVVPTGKDVLLGQGKRFRSHKGNMALEKLIEANQQAYIAASTRFEKTCIVAGIVQKTKEAGCRFLRVDEKTKKWATVQDVVAHEAISMRFRNRSRVRRTSTGSMQSSKVPERVESQRSVSGFTQGENVTSSEQSDPYQIPLLIEQLRQQKQQQDLQRDQHHLHLLRHSRQHEQQRQLLDEIQLLVDQRRQQHQQVLLDQLHQQIQIERSDRERQLQLQLEVQGRLQSGLANRGMISYLSELVSSDGGIPHEGPLKKRFRGVWK